MEGKRNFINRKLGNYNPNAQNPLIDLLKGTGMQPFATAAATGLVQSANASLGFLPGTYGKPWATKAAQMAKILPLFAIGPSYNLVKWGQAFPQGVPVFSAKTGEDDDGTPTYRDPLGGPPGIRRGWKALTIEAGLRGMHEGKTGGEMFNDAVWDISHALLHVVAGPAVETAWIGATGKNLIGQQMSQVVSTARTPQGIARAEALGKPPPGSSQRWENIKAAMLHLVPLAEKAEPAAAKEQAKPILERFGQTIPGLQEKRGTRPERPIGIRQRRK
jgi:hypothetical protein